MGMFFGQRSGGGDRRSARSQGTRTSGFRLIAPETYNALSGNARNRRKYASEGPGAVRRQGTIAPRGNIRRLPANGSGGNAEFCPAWGLHPQFNPRAAGPEGRSRPERQVPRSKCRHPAPTGRGQPRCRCRAAGSAWSGNTSRSAPTFHRPRPSPDWTGPSRCRATPAVRGR